MRLWLKLFVTIYYQERIIPSTGPDESISQEETSPNNKETRSTHIVFQGFKERIENVEGEDKKQIRVLMPVGEFQSIIEPRTF